MPHAPAMHRTFKSKDALLNNEIDVFPVLTINTLAFILIKIKVNK